MQRSVRLISVFLLVVMLIGMASSALADYSANTYLSFTPAGSGARIVIKNTGTTTLTVYRFPRNDKGKTSVGTYLVGRVMDALCTIKPGKEANVSIPTNCAYTDITCYSGFLGSKNDRWIVTYKYNIK